MSNIIDFSKNIYKEDKISMSNQGTDCFLELLIIASETFEMSENQKKLISFLKDLKDINNISPGTVSFSIVEMPWSKDTLSEDILFMMNLIKKAKTADVLRKLDYQPNTEIVFPWLNQFSMMIWKLDKKYIYGAVEAEIVKNGIASIYKVLISDDSDAKRRLLFYLDWYLDPYYENDLSQFYEPIKEMLQDIVIKENEDDIKQEALYLLEAYMDGPYDIFEENINDIPQQYIDEVKSLIKTSERKE